ncbi:DUF4910 domain-containing protein [Candidatus Sumerlaeota bacterium]|nr:DUF4910 domain-containing protein [Candidatus Sumerlaeota bacterium]
MNDQYHYTQTDLARALKKIGVCNGDVVFSHSNLGFLGIPQGGNTRENVFNTVWGAFREALGSEGTLCVPTFTYSFCKNQPFDPDHTPSTVGMFTEMIRTLPGAVRSCDPIFSVAAIGSKAHVLLDDVSNECFGPGSFWERLLENDGSVCNVGIGAHSAFAHFVENTLKVPYRYKKLFHGQLVIKGKQYKHAVLYFCHDIHDPRTVLETRRFENLARSKGFVHAEMVGRGEVNRIKCTDIVEICKQGLKENKWFLVNGPREGEAEDLCAPSQMDIFDTRLDRNASMMEIIGKLWTLPRDIISDGYDAALYAIASQLEFITTKNNANPQMIIHKYPTGTEAYTWIVPEKWTCREARLETLDGKTLFSSRDNPLHCLSYSLPFQGEVSRDVLFQRLHTHPRIPDAIPYKFKYYERDWGLCCSESLKQTLTDQTYRVMIDTEFRYGNLKVAEFILPGESPDSIVLCAHLCHPRMAQDDLTGVAVGVELMRRLAALPKRHYTYRFLIVPETIGSLCWLSSNENLHPLIKGGLFLEMLGLDNPAALQMSFQGDSQIDKCFWYAVREKEPDAWRAPFRKVICNDERQFNAPGIRIPMLSLSRVFKPDSGKWPYPQYHTDQDTPETVSRKKLEDSVDLALTMLHYLEQNRILINKFKGEVFCSRYAMHIDYDSDHESHAALFGALDFIDGSHTVADISERLNVTFSAILRIADLLEQKGLIEKELSITE